MDDFAEKLTNARSPHRLDTVFNDEREPTLHPIDPVNATVVHYSRGIWSVVGLPIDLRCPNTTAKKVATAQALIRRFGFLAPPIPSNTLWWALRPYTTFGVDDSVDSMLTQMAMVQQRGLLAMLIPTRIIHHRSIVTPGFMDTEELIGHCSIDFPDGLVTGRQGEIQLEKIVLKELEDHTPSQSGSCDIDAVGRVIDQIDAIEMRMRDAGRLEQSCIDHSAEYPRPEPHSTADEVIPEARSLKVGFLKHLSSYKARSSSHSSSARCSSTVPRASRRLQPLRHRLWNSRRMRNLANRALSYTATDAFGKCWQLAEGLIIPKLVEVNPKIRFCRKDPFTDPSRSVNITLAASSCLKDDSGSASYVRRVLQGGSAVVHRQLFSGVGDDCDAKVHRSLLADSRVPNSIESCMEVVYGA
ncbi:hypothetical protein FOZ63_026192 [Perkinsus olseni]|uniref:Uncharacterized protein n=1 Tax=Perkinsus olseni TaxID=32597 RepID=A0A7J6PRJ2_PEROL|nr:hypothetical protein FOZ63_026192 [Perkinsus olseni]